VTIDTESKLLSENQSVYVPLGSVHRLENPGLIPLTLIEVQSGPYLGEDDIVRLEDVYLRVLRGLREWARHCVRTSPQERVYILGQEPAGMTKP